jgi:predicted nuclease with TOPRIM domain
MTNEDFQALVLEKLTSLASNVKGLENVVSGLGNEFKGLENDVNGLGNEFKGLVNEVKGLKASHDELARKIDVVCEQTAILTEFKSEVSDKLDTIIEDNKSIQEILGEHEIAIRTLRRKPV